MQPHRQVVVLTYHGISKDPITAKAQRFSRYIEDFKTDLKTISRLGYDVILFPNLIDRPLVRDAVIITFDDGKNSQLDYAAPILKKHEMPATFFIVYSLIGAQYHLTYPRVDELRREGFHVESHGYNHVHFDRLEPEELNAEMIRSEAAAHMVNPLCKGILALPYGDVNTPEMQTAAKNAGFKMVRNALGGAISLGKFDAFNIPSYLIYHDTDLEVLLSRRSYWPNSAPQRKRR